MIRNVVKAASARLAASLFGLMLMVVPSLAGDRALIDFIGFSEDGQYFAFEEYGVQDGSGFAYSNIYVVDLAADKWVSGSPFRVQADDETYETPLRDIRDEAMGEAQEMLDELGIVQPVEILALLGDAVPDNDGKRLEFSVPMCCGPGQTQDDRLALEIETFDVTTTDDYCIEMEPVGYALTFVNEDDVVELHRDGDVLPASRGCTLDYRLYAVVQPFWDAGSRVAIISSYPFGFEGPDRRFLAVPID